MQKEEKGKIRMKTFLSVVKKFYHEFFYKDTFIDSDADKVLKGKDNLIRRKSVIKETYKMVLENNAISDEVKFYVKSDYSLNDVCRMKEVNLPQLRSQIYYVNANMGKDLTYNGEYILKIVIFNDIIKDSDWEEINKIMQAVQIKRCKSLYNKANILNNRNLLVNIPHKEYCTEVKEGRFEMFIRLIEPYLISTRKLVQQRINTEFLEEAGYLNFLMTPGVSLSKDDKRRLSALKRLLDETTLDEYKKESKNRLLDLNKLEKDLTESEAENIKADLTNQEYKEGLKAGTIKAETTYKRIQMDF